MTKYLVPFTFSAFLARILIFGATLGDSIAMASLCGLTGYWLYLQSKQEPIVNKDLKDRLIALEEKTSKHDSKLGALQLRR